MSQIVVKKGEEGEAEVGIRGNGKEPPGRLVNSVSVSVSVSSPESGRNKAAGLADRLKTRIVAKQSFSAKWTFFEPVPGVSGAERVRWFNERGDADISGCEKEDLRDDFNGLPFDKIECDDARVGKGRVSLWGEEDGGEERGKGMVSECAGPVLPVLDLWRT
jgi:hypothetical protein